MTPYYQADGITVKNQRCETVMDELPDDSVDLILTDPPYFKVKGDWWDQQWEKPAAFVEWIGGLCDQWRRVLKPNGSLYVFASPQMAWHVEGEVRQRFNVLTNIRWMKDNGWHRKADEEVLRAPFPASETIIFAEQFNSDNHALGETDYTSKCDELRGFVFEPLRAYLCRSRNAAGLTTGQIDDLWQAERKSKGCMAGHWFGVSQWQLPTDDNFDFLERCGLQFDRTREDLRREYEDLRREYEDLRRPFNASETRPYTDVWDFPTVSDHPGKHPCQKPLKMMEHIIETSTRPDAMILDCFAGSGVVGRAARNYGRRALLCEVDERWYKKIVAELGQSYMFTEAETFDFAGAE